MTGNFDLTFQVLTGYPRLSWQRRLFEKLYSGDVPEIVDLPTGLGKTSVIAIWLIALACQIKEGKASLPRRLIYIVNRRTVVDQATEVVTMMRNKLGSQELDWLRQCLQNACATCAISGETPLAISTLRGELADNGEWKVDPSRPSIIIGTIDMIGSKLLFAGYGDSYKQRPHHAGLIGQDTLIVHDEAHLTPAFSRLLDSIKRVQKGSWEKSRSVRIMELSATPLREGEGIQIFKLNEEDLQDGIVRQRLYAKKELRIHTVFKEMETETIVNLAVAHEDARCKVLIYVNTPEKAKEVAQALKKRLRKESGQRIAMLTGTLRGYERDRLMSENPVLQAFLKPEQSLNQTHYLISTSAGEVGIDLDADHAVSDLTTLEALIQRLGRVNRRGGEGRVAQIDIVVVEDTEQQAAKEKGEDPIKKALKQTLKALSELPRKECGTHDARPDELRKLLSNHPAAIAPQPEILPLTDIHLDSLSLTSLARTLPTLPDVSLLLHGQEKEQAETYVAWRKEVRLLAWLSQPQIEEWFDHCPIETKERLREVTYRVKEQLEAIKERRGDLPVIVISQRGEVEAKQLEEVLNFSIAYKTVVLPTEAGGLSNEGLLDGKAEGNPFMDVAEQSGTRKRLLVKRDDQQNWRVSDLDGVDDAPPLEGQSIRDVATQVATKYGLSVAQLVSLSGEFGEAEKFLLLLVERKKAAYETPESTPANGAQPPTIKEHCALAQRWAVRFTEKLGLEGELKEALAISAQWHDKGKDRPLWQRAIGNSDSSTCYAKSGPQGMDNRALNGYRHEFGSLLDAARDACIQSHSEQDLILHLIASHHGWARPHFLASAQDIETPEPENARVAEETMRRFACLQRRFGRWGLAWLESLMRCADVLASMQLLPPEDGGVDKEE